MFAGLWDRCATADLGDIESFTIVTQPAGAPLNGYHDGAPFVLQGSKWARWLDIDDPVDDLLRTESRDCFTVTKAAIRWRVGAQAARGTTSTRFMK